jgi:hypothetical protein
MPADAYSANFDRYPTNIRANDFPRQAVAVTNSDTQDITNAANLANTAQFYARGLWIPAAGAIKVTMAGDKGAVDPAGAENPVTISGIPAGTYLPIQVRRVWSTGTTVSGTIIAFTD